MSVFGDVLGQHTAVERISSPDRETFITLKLNGNGAVRRKVGEGKTPAAFAGYRVRSGQFIYSRIDARNGAFAIVPDDLDGAVVSKDFPVFDVNTDRLDLRYLLHYVTSPGFVNRIKALSFGATNRQRVKEEIFLNLPVTLPPLDEQRRIAAILDKVDELRAARRRTLELLDALDRSAFNEVFGNAVVPLNDWELKPLRTLGVITTGNTPPRSDASNYGKHIEWIKSDNIRPDRTYVAAANEMLSESGAKKARIVEAGSVLVTCIAGSPKTIGNAAIANRPIAFNQQINAFTPNEGPALFWRGLLRAAQPVVQAASTGGMTGMVSKSAFGSIAVIDAPLDVQAQYAEESAHIEAARFAHSAQLAKLERLFASLQYRAFAGEL